MILADKISCRLFSCHIVAEQTYELLSLSCNVEAQYVKY